MSSVMGRGQESVSSYGQGAGFSLQLWAGGRIMSPVMGNIAKSIVTNIFTPSQTIKCCSWPSDFGLRDTGLLRDNRTSQLKQESEDELIRDCE